ncbi:uncharacterized protein B0H18DRAFT_952006 [Fomitopsis serialis]|uniref:uncharacterized protein n=1 Tax=Fomitopsis serialis TaxID=139415 RepID=UPI0020075719|nr:uncharacterized protein B0H18DRAFT_952006 [Neoantrodia serialis]KAH9933475.1 hypothetical protein B0H18DRAFT_952006 [Neoantrodia serialis]
MKSCLKSPSPPYSPYPSAPPSPGERPQLQKTVSFCADDDLEEVFEVDEWDRSPAPVTPKLSYEDVLELKQLRLSLPRPAPPPTYRQPFTTSLPTAYTAAASSSRPFPVSRFAAQPSHTPSKWKNRGTTRLPCANLDADILPYLDAVPIRLLPLLDTPPEPEPPSPELLAESEPISRLDSPSPQPTLSPPPQPSPVQTPPAPPSAPPPSLPSPLSPSNSLSPSPVSSPSTPTATSPPPVRRLPSFSFIPLLPVQPASPPPPPPEPVRLTVSQKRMNMTFLPLVAPPSPPSALPPSLPEPHPEPASETDGAMEPESELAPTPTLAPIPEPSPSPPALASALSTTSAASGSDSPLDVSPDGETDESEDYNDLPARALSPTDLSTPALSSASESDTDEHDGDTDADQDGDEARAHGRSHGFGGHAHPALAEYEYFAARLTSSSAGQTPPLSSIYPEVDVGHYGAPEEADAAASVGAGLGMNLGLGRLPLGMRMQMQAPASMALKKMKLAALPSPALAPPSPFSLYPSSPGVGGSPFVPRELREMVTVGERNAVALEKTSVIVPPDMDGGDAWALEAEIEGLTVVEGIGEGEGEREGERTR